MSHASITELAKKPLENHISPGLELFIRGYRLTYFKILWEKEEKKCMVKLTYEWSKIQDISNHQKPPGSKTSAHQKMPKRSNQKKLDGFSSLNALAKNIAKYFNQGDLP